jgi:hypothetical protein
MASAVASSARRAVARAAAASSSSSFAAGARRWQSKSATEAAAAALPAVAPERAAVVPTSEQAKLGNIGEAESAAAGGRREREKKKGEVPLRENAINLNRVFFDDSLLFFSPRARALFLFLPPAVTVPWNRFNVESTDHLDVERFRRTAVLSNTMEDVKGRKVRREEGERREREPRHPFPPSQTASHNDAVPPSFSAHPTQAYIYKVSQHAMTSGFSSSKWWSVRLDSSTKWTNPLMGYLSSADTAQQMSQLNRFETAEQAVLFCERNGIEYEVQSPTERERGAVDNQYAYNFLPKEVQSRMKNVGARKSRPIFRNPDSPSNAGTSTFVSLSVEQ